MNPFGQVNFNPKPIASILRPVVIVGAGPDSFELDQDSLARLERFRNRTVTSVGTPKSHHIYRNDVMRLALQVRGLLGLF